MDVHPSYVSWEHWDKAGRLMMSSWDPVEAKVPLYKSEVLVGRHSMVEQRMDSDGVLETHIVRKYYKIKFWIMKSVIHCLYTLI